jgi:F-type H+-transporting ATPase subunit b
MQELFCSNIFTTLGLSWQKILLYLANFAVLCVGLTFLIYKPVKKYMKKRKSDIENEVAAAAKARADAENEVAEQQKKTAAAFEEIKAKAAEARQAKEDVLKERDGIIEEARKKAEQIAADAEEKAQAERRQAVVDAKNDIASMSVKIAGEILGREISGEENSRLIDESIKKWSDND